MEHKTEHRFRLLSFFQLFFVPLYLLLFLTNASADVGVPSHWATSSPVINGIVTPGEWANAANINLTHGNMAIMNDGAFLYVKLDVIDDTGNDSTVPPGDYYVLAFDVDLNRAITPNVDLIYDACNDGRPFIKAYYLGGSSFTGCQTTSASSEGAYGFGPTGFSVTSHRVYEFKLDFAEIGVDPTTWTISTGEFPQVRMNVATISANPPFSSAEPAPSLFPDLTNLFQVALATIPTYPGGTGPIFAGVGLVPATYIDSNGYANINIANYYSATDAPFGGNLNVFGTWDDLYNNRGARKYKVMYSKNGGTLTPLLQTWTNFRLDPVTFDWVPVAIGPDINGKYDVPPSGQNWYLQNLLIGWQSSLFGEGTYTLSLELYDAANNPIAIASGNSLTLFVVNTPPAPVINEITYFDGFSTTPVSACAIVTQGANTATGFNYNISVTDANGALSDFSLYGIFGNNQYTPTIYSDTYSNHIDGSQHWNGVTNLVVPADVWRASTECAYSFILSAGSRVQNGYGLIFYPVQYHVSLTILMELGGASQGRCGLVSINKGLKYGTQPLGSTGGSVLNTIPAGL